MRGTVPTWIWIGGGIIAGLLIFIAAYLMLSQTTNALSEAKSTEPFYNLKNIVENDLCFATSGNQRKLDMELSESIVGIYATDDKYANLSDSDYPQKILSSEVSQGKILCMKVKDRRLLCEGVSCVVKMPYIGAVPEEESLSALIDKVFGRHKTFEYNLELTREADYVSATKG